jgi:hypothetical protein
LFNNLDVERFGRRFNVWHPDVDERFGAGGTTMFRQERPWLGRPIRPAKRHGDPLTFHGVD